VPTYDELVVVASRKRLEDDPESVRLFLGALARGAAAAAQSPNAAAKALHEANADLDLKLTEAEVEATLPSLSTDLRMNPAAWGRFIAWMSENELISSSPPASAVMSDDYLPGNIPE
jgi:ABC-type nitrate/sulfonate/bicarbonate transport system substrate-binding protein